MAGRCGFSYRACASLIEVDLAHDGHVHRAMIECAVGANAGLVAERPVGKEPLAFVHAVRVARLPDQRVPARPPLFGVRHLRHVSFAVQNAESSALRPGDQRRMPSAG